MKCKLCDSLHLNIQCVIKFNHLHGKNEALGIPDDGADVYYFRCAYCGFLFTNHMDDWTPTQFKEHIYNDQYALIDPDYISARPNYNFWQKFYDV